MHSSLPIPGSQFANKESSYRLIPSPVEELREQALQYYHNRSIVRACRILSVTIYYRVTLFSFAKSFTDPVFLALDLAPSFVFSFVRGRVHPDTAHNSGAVAERISIRRVLDVGGGGDEPELLDDADRKALR